MMRHYHNKKAFTMIEIIVVVVIVGILASLAVPKIMMTNNQPMFAEGTSTVSAIRNAQELYFLEEGSYATNLGDVDVELPALKYYTTVTLFNQSTVSSVANVIARVDTGNIGGRSNQILIDNSGNLTCINTNGSSVCDQFKVP